MNTPSVQEHIRGMFLRNEKRCDETFCPKNALFEQVRGFTSEGEKIESLYFCGEHKKKSIGENAQLRCSNCGHVI